MKKTGHDSHPPGNGDVGNDRACCAPARDPATTTASGGRTAPVTDSIGRAFTPDDGIVDIPGGRGLIGTNEALMPLDGERPLRVTKVAPFRMDEAVVTNARFAEFVAATGHVTDAERLGDSFVFLGLMPSGTETGPTVEGTPWWCQVSGANWRRILGPDASESNDPDHPAVHVTWNDANAFAKWAGGRLPTEVEWEHAARGGLGDVRFPWGDDEPDDTDFLPCNIWQGRFPHHNSMRDGFFGTAPVRSFEPNGFGLFNMVGNVWEWTSQPFRVSTLRSRVKRFHAHKSGFRLAKGGSFLCHASYCYRYRIAARYGTSPDSSMSHQGFRVVYDV